MKKMLQLFQMIEAEFPQKDGKHHCAYMPSPVHQATFGLPGADWCSLGLQLHIDGQMQLFNLTEEDLEKEPKVLFDELMQLIPGLQQKTPS